MPSAADGIPLLFVFSPHAIREEELLKTVLAFALYFGLAAQVAVSSDKRTMIYGTNWGLTLEIDETGFYNEVMFMALRGLEDQAEYRVQPYVRALQSFAGEPGSCIYSQSIELLSELDVTGDVGEMIETRSIVDYSGHIFWSQSAAPIKSRDDLRGKRIGHLLGADYSTLFEELSVRPMVVNTETQKIKMLFTKRVDGIVGFIPDIYMVFKANGYDPQPFDTSFVLMRSGNSIVCQRSPATELLIKGLDDHIGQLRELGVIDKLLGDAGVPEHVIALVKPKD